MTTELQTAPDAPTETFVSFDKPLTPEAIFTLDSLKKRYVDEEGLPLVIFETESLVCLRIPKVFHPVFMERAS